ncbi:alcohol dehydrogenase [Diaporthe helianthi]|uniref:Alcohol dehydrogenase n=1 Tax=Diaporthe helianthi TaxID=158607 RepID=A0A2P5IA01_DIAHE|nr:alcohol dehydrogenase [Diaporthe helianthi]
MSLPTTMKSLAAPTYGPPDVWEVIEVPVPELKNPDELLLRMHAAAIGPGDCGLVSGRLKSQVPIMSWPSKIAHEGAGVVVAIGSAVTAFKPGDAVYGYNMKHPILPVSRPGFCSEYAIANESLLLRKPAHISFEEAAALPGHVVTALQAIRCGMMLNPAAFLQDPVKGELCLRGKRVFVNAGLGAATSVAAQVAKNVFGAAEVVTTVSTGKMALVEKELPGVYDRVVNYETAADEIGELGRGQVDFFINARMDVKRYLPVMEPKNGVVASIRGIPSSTAWKSLLGSVSLWVGWMLDLSRLWYKWLLLGTNVKLDVIQGNFGIREDVDEAGRIIEQQLVKAVVTVVPLDDVDSIRQKAKNVVAGKGNVGKVVVKII